MRRTLIGSILTLVAVAGLQIGMVLHEHRATPDATLVKRALASAGAAPVAGTGVIRTGSLVQIPNPPTFDVQVLALYDIFLAGRTYPFALSGRYGTDRAGRNSPQEVAVTVPAGTAVTFAVQTIVAPPHTGNANGRIADSFLAGPREEQAGAGPVSSVIAPPGSLVGVFTGALRPKILPPTLDFRTPQARNAPGVHPQLAQVFFIGTGRTAGGALKRFIVPAGAHALWLGILSHLGASHAARGTYEVAVTGNAPVVVPYIPIPTATTVVSPTAVITPGAVDTVFPTDTPTPTFPILPTYTPVAPVTAIGLPSATPTLTGTPVPSATVTTTPTATSTATWTPTATPSPTFTATPTATVFIFPTP
jgi:hypothetical protein